MSKFTIVLLLVALVTITLAKPQEPSEKSVNVIDGDQQINIVDNGNQVNVVDGEPGASPRQREKRNVQ